MRNVTRAPKPRSLATNAARWKRELLAEIDDATANGRKPQSKFFDKYNKPDVRLALQNMYSNCCCYCEAYIAVVTKPHIEHRKPKAANRFPELTFEWNNLHLGCPNCNGAKSDQWDNNDEVLDAVQDVPITDHLSYELSEVGVLRAARTDRGVTTVNFADLNREAMCQAQAEGVDARFAGGEGAAQSRK